MNWTCKPCTDGNHDHCEISRADPLKPFSELLGLPEQRQPCHCGHVYTEALADILGAVICNGWEPESLLYYSDELAKDLPDPAHDTSETAARRVAGLILRKVVRDRLTEGALSS